ncbi:OmpH family outer membrane protein [Hyphomonas sp.]|jgi:outer membrane protein|uniref:OmpH family outer membrane protein n=1 Tax=Hyphomonas sp. TaxID=87 RepID=UPI0032D95FA1
MSRLKNFFLAMVVSIAAVAVVAPASFAQGTTVITIDEAKILRDSKAGKDIQTKLQNIESQINNELTPTKTSLETEGKTLNTELQGKTREQVAADAALVAKLNAYDKKASDFGKARQKAANEFSLTERQALVDFNKALEPVLLEVVREKNAQVVLSKSAIIYGVDSVDVSALVISKLDAATPTLAVVRKRIPDQPAQ